MSSVSHVQEMALGLDSVPTPIAGRELYSLIFAHSHQPVMRGLFPYERPGTEPGEFMGDGTFGPIRVRYGPLQGITVANHTDQAAGECYTANLDNLRHMVTGWTPTLLMQLGDPITPHNRKVFETIKEIGREQKGHFLAELFSHPIAPFLSDENLSIQLDWGLAFYDYMFGYAPKSIWFAESAVDTRVLHEASIRGIENIILASWQVRGAHNTLEPYIAQLGDRAMNVILYHPVSREVSFEDLATFDAAQFIAWQELQLFQSSRLPQLMVIASDIELYNHHMQGKHLFAAGYFRLLRKEGSPINLVTDIEQYIKEHRPTKKVDLVENTSWSCGNSLARWRIGGHENWKASVRAAIDNYDCAFWNSFYEKGSTIFKDSFSAAKSYIKVLLEPSNLEPLKAEMMNPTDDNIQKALYLLDAMAFVQFMHTSCALFFIDPGLETEGAFKAAYFSLQSLKKTGLYGDDELEALERAFVDPLRESKRGIVPQSSRLSDDYGRVVGYHAQHLALPEYQKRTSLPLPELFHFAKS